MRNNGIPVRVFIVGCSRSGTTLLQRLLSEHPLVMTFPESHFFLRTSPKGAAKIFGIPRRGASAHVHRFLESAGMEGALSSRPHPLFGFKRWARWFIAALDAAAEDQGKKVWIEKTPMHLHCIPDIVRAAPDAKFIHIIRSGWETSFSLYRVTQSFPRQWGGARTPQMCARRWAEDVKISLRFQNRKLHRLLRYESLTMRPADIIREMHLYLELPLDSLELKNDGSKPRDFILSEEKWKKDAAEEIFSAGAEPPPWTAKQMDDLRPIIEPVQRELDEVLPPIDRGSRHSSCGSSL